MEPLLVSINDAAKALGIGRSTVYKKVGEGVLETVSIGRRNLIKMTSIRKLLESQDGEN